MTEVLFTNLTAAVYLPPPLLGEHNRAVLGKLGYSDAEIAKLTT